MGRDVSNDVFTTSFVTLRTACDSFCISMCLPVHLVFTGSIHRKILSPLPFQADTYCSRDVHSRFAEAYTHMVGKGGFFRPMQLLYFGESSHKVL